MTLLVATPPGYEPERTYILDVVFTTFLGIRWAHDPRPVTGVEIRTADDPDGRRLRVAEDLFACPPDGWLTEACLPTTPLPYVDVHDADLRAGVLDPRLPLMQRRTPPPEWIRAVPGGWDLEIDLFGGMFLQLTRFEEIAVPARDAHGRFPADRSLTVRAGTMQRPLVNEHLEVLRAILHRLWPRLVLPRRSPRVLVSHDIDWVVHQDTSAVGTVRGAAGDLLKRRDAGLAASRTRAAFAAARGRPERDPYHSHGFIMDQSERRGLRSAFYFLIGCSDPRYDSAYDTGHPNLQRAVREIAARGHEVGLHPSYGSLERPELIASEFAALRRACDPLGIDQDRWGGRQHFLRWANPTSWQAWESAGLTYDSSLGFSRDPGFRAGTCFEYPVFDLVRRVPLRLLERPLVVMDAMVLDPEAVARGHTLASVATLSQTVRRYGGDLTLLWHNSMLSSRRQRADYIAALDMACVH